MQQSTENLFSDFIIAYAEGNELSKGILRTRIQKLYEKEEISTQEIVEIYDMLFDLEGVIQ